MDSIEEYVAERDQKLTECDLDWIIEQTGCDPALAEPVLHKCRYEATFISRELRLISAEWLRQHGFKGLTGPLLPEGELPE